MSAPVLTLKVVVGRVFRMVTVALLSISSVKPVPLPWVTLTSIFDSRWRKVRFTCPECMSAAWLTG